VSTRRPDDAPVAPGVAASGEHVCARCTRALSATCCEVQPHERLATLTWADVERLSAVTGLPLEAFGEWEWLDADHVQAWLDVHPAYGAYLAAEPRRLTLRAQDGACVFLERGKGCRLEPNQRPTMCQLYPFDVDGRLQVDRFGSVAEARETVVRGAANACLAVEEASGFAALYRAFTTTGARVRALGERLRAELAEHAAVEARLKARGHRRR
jgi:uncharacterized protein